MFPTRLLAFAGIAVLPALALAQASAPRPDPLDPNAPTTSLEVPRTFDEYVPFKEPTVAPWRETNTAVTPSSSPKTGGPSHSHAPGMEMPQSAPSAEEPGRGQPKPGSGHAGHKM